MKKYNIYLLDKYRNIKTYQGYLVESKLKEVLESLTEQQKECVIIEEIKEKGEER